MNSFFPIVDLVLCAGGLFVLGLLAILALAFIRQIGPFQGQSPFYKQQMKERMAVGRMHEPRP